MAEGYGQFIYNPDLNSFDVDLSVDEVPIDSSASDLQDINSRKYFPEGGGLLIEGINICFPYQFGQATLLPLQVNLRWANRDNSQNGDLDQFGDGGALLVPEPNNLVALDTYVSYPATALDWRISVEVLGRVNMFNAPTDLDGDTIPIMVFLQIRTAYQLSL